MALAVLSQPRLLCLQALTALGCMEHRGACSADDDSGDGAGLMTQIPWKLLKQDMPGLDEQTTGCALRGLCAARLTSSSSSSWSCASVGPACAHRCTAPGGKSRHFSHIHAHQRQQQMQKIVRHSLLPLIRA